MVDDLVQYLVRLAGVPYYRAQAMRPTLERWAKRLPQMGVYVVPKRGDWARWTRGERAHAVNVINMFLSDFSGDRWTAHLLHDITGVRPFKGPGANR